MARILLGITGSIAAFKAPDIASQLTRRGHDVTGVMTRDATEFITPLTVQVLSKNPVVTGFSDEAESWRPGHIQLADEADLILLAPATAHLIAQLAAGLAGDVLTAICLAARSPILIAPAMNGKMWDHPATRRNVETLRTWNYEFIGPEEGMLACGYEGVGRLWPIGGIVEKLAKSWTATARAGEKEGMRVKSPARFLITAGPTREPLDPVRYLTNRSSGRMGYAIAAAAAAAGHHVTLVSGPTAIELPPGVDFVPVESADEMFRAVESRIARAGVCIMAAAVSDYRPVKAAARKIKSAGNLVLELETTPDILGSARDPMGFEGLLVGFAAETDNVAENARLKLKDKRCDFIAANDVSQKGIGFDSLQNEIALYFKDGREQMLGKHDKSYLASLIVDVCGRELSHRDYRIG